MFIWFLILAPVAVAEVFKSPMLDYRLVALGAVLPLGEAVFGGPRVLHTLLFCVAAMALVMVLTMNSRLLRRRLLGLPIGLMLHLVLDGSFADQNLFWWPAFGFDFGSAGLPAWGRPAVVGVGLELIGLAVAVWAYRRYELANEVNRALLIGEGRLSRAVLA